VNVTCPECRSVFRVDPSRIPGGAVRARCSVCGGVITIVADGAAAPDEFAVAGASATAYSAPRPTPVAAPVARATPPIAPPAMITPAAAMPSPAAAPPPRVTPRVTPPPLTAQRPAMSPVPPAGAPGGGYYPG